MPLSALHRYLVRRTFTHLAIHADEVTALFSQRLVELNPALMIIIVDEAGTQRYRPLEILARVIALMDRPAALSIQLKLLQAQQQRSVTPDHLRQMGEALLWVIENRLGDSFTPDISAAWLHFYRFLGELSTYESSSGLASDEGQYLHAD